MTKWFFIRIRDCTEDQLPRLKKTLRTLGRVAASGFGTATEASAGWFAVGVQGLDTSAVREELGKLGLNERTDIIAPVWNPIEGRALSRQLALF